MLLVRNLQLHHVMKAIFVQSALHLKFHARQGIHVMELVTLHQLWLHALQVTIVLVV